MKKINIKHILVITIILVLTYACKDEITYNPVKINSVWSNSADTLRLVGEQHTIESMKIGTWIRLNGTGFTGLKQILCNGESAYFYVNYFTDSDITFKIPATTPIPGDSSITVITNHGEYTYKPFIFK